MFSRSRRGIKIVRIGNKTLRGKQMSKKNDTAKLAFKFVLIIGVVNLFADLTGLLWRRRTLLVLQCNV